MRNPLTLATCLESFAQPWNLDATGNWSDFHEDPSGTGLILYRTAASGRRWTRSAYNAVGNTTSFPQLNTSTRP
jgi:hypothetical protein